MTAVTILDNPAIEELSQRRQWVAWNSEPGPNGKITKVPKNPRTGGNASSAKPETWGDFLEAQVCAKERGYTGIGFVFTSDDPYTGFDLDDCLDTAGNLTPKAAAVLSMADSYAEISPSGKGIKIFCKGDIPATGKKQGDFEAYRSERFFTVTGNHWPGSPKIIKLVDGHKVFSFIFDKPETKETPARLVTPLNLTDQELLQKALTAANGDKFSHLWNGQVNGYHSRSEAHLALCNHLAFWTGADPDRMDRLFRQSAFYPDYSDKWDERHFSNGDTYGQGTIRKAIELTTFYYTPTANENGVIKSATVLPIGDDDPQPTFKRLSLAELIQRPAKEWLIQNFIGQGDITMLFGDAGTGKTFATVDLIFSAILGREFAGKFAIERPLSVAYTASEGIGGLPQRFLAAANRYQTGLDQSNFNVFLDVPQLFDDKALTSVHSFVNDWRDFHNTPLDLLIIDTLHGATAGADENQSKDAGLILRAMKYARDTLNCAVLLVHHANRQGTYRGSSALHGAMDTMLQTKVVTDNVFTLECFKQKDAERFTPLYFRLAPEHYSQSVYVEWLDQQTLSLDNTKPLKTTAAKQDILDLLERKPKLNQSAIVAALPGYERKTILKALDELESNGKILTDKGPNNSKLYGLSVMGQPDRTTDK